jgi:hypothetical protein
MYGLPQAGIIAQELLAKRLRKHGYTQSKTMPGLWTHEWHPITFSLIVDNFGVNTLEKNMPSTSYKQCKKIIRARSKRRGKDIAGSPSSGIMSARWCTF